jgi:hypothetical protein
MENTENSQHSSSRKLSKKQRLELHREYKFCGGKSLEWRRKCELMLPQIAEEEIWREIGFCSIYEYAAKLSGMGRSVVDEVLRVWRRIEDKPALQEVARKKGFARVRPVAAIATCETQDFWAGKAKEMGKSVLETYVRNYREEALPRKDSPRLDLQKAAEFCEDPDVKNQQNEQQENNFSKREVKVTVKLRADLVDRLKKRGDLDAMMEKFLDFVEVMEDVGVECEGEAAKPEAVWTENRHIPVKIQRHVEGRAGGKCEFPGCCKDGEIFHHTRRFALEKAHDPDGIVMLCREHERLAHLGLIENEEGSPENWSLRGEANFDTQEERAKRWVDGMVASYRLV